MARVTLCGNHGPHCETAARERLSYSWWAMQKWMKSALGGVRPSPDV